MSQALFTDEQNGRDFFLLKDYNEGVLTNQAATATIVCRFRCPVALTIKRLDAVYETEAGTGPALTFEVRRSTTAILSAACTTAATMVSDTVAEASQVLTCDAGEELNIALTSANADNDFTGVQAQVWAVRR